MKANGLEVALRRATLTDSAMVFGWRNRPELLRFGTSQRPVTKEEHTHWFQEMISGTTQRMFIILSHSEAIGQIRFDKVDEQTSIVSVYLLPEFCGEGAGTEAIRLGCAQVRTSGSNTVLAYVRQDNARAARAFRKAGFSECGDVCPPGHIALRWRELSAQ